MKTNEFLKTGYEGLATAELVKSPITILIGVSEIQQQTLVKLGIHTMFDLAMSPIFKGAYEIAVAAIDPQHPFARYGIPSADAGVGSKSPQDLVDDSIEALSGITTGIVSELQNSLGVTTVRDFAFWPPYLAARQLVDLGFNNTETGQFTAPEIVPKFGEYATENVYYSRLITISGPNDTARDLDSPINILNLSSNVGLKPYLGARLTFCQNWTPEAITLGQLLNSLSLAPGETTKIAVIDWMRKSRSSSEEDIAQSESLTNTLEQSRSLNEVAKAVATEIQGGTSASSSASTSAAATAAGAAWSPVAAGAAGTAASASAATSVSVSASAGRKDIESELGQQIDSSTEQASMSERSKRAALVTEATQQEREEITTRSVTNYNHMHTLNILYFEVVQLYRVRLKLDKAERVLFVPMEVLKFNYPVITRFQQILARAAINSSVRYWLSNLTASVVTSLQAQPASSFIAPTVPINPPNPIEEAKRKAMEKAKRQVRMAVRRAIFNNIINSIPNSLTSIDADASNWEMDQDCKIINIGWKLEGRNLINSVIIKTRSNQVFDIAVNAGILQDAMRAPIAPSLGTGVLVSDLESLELNINAANIESIQEITIYFSTQDNIKFSVPCDIIIPDNQTRLPLMNFSLQEKSRELIQHLNENSLYYSQYIWRNLDPQTLGAMLAPFSFQGKRLLEYLDMQPIAVTGNHLAFLFPDDDDETWNAWKKKKLTTTFLSNRLIALPTGGVFAEGVLGRSNCAEKLDMTRFWNWQDSPPPIQAPDIAAIQAGKHTAEQAQRAGGLDSPVINIMNPPSLPDPSGLGAILSAISNSGMFRDMSGLAGTQGLAATGMQTTANLTGNALAAATGLVGSVAPFGAAMTTGTMVGSRFGNGNTPIISATPNSAAESIGRGLERRTSPATSTVSATGAMLNHAQDMDRRSAGLMTTRKNLAPDDSPINNYAVENSMFRGVSPSSAHIRPFLKEEISFSKSKIFTEASPSTFGRSISIDALLPSDIILVTRPGITSGFIRAVTRSPVSHAILYIGNEMVIESVTNGVVKRSIYDAFNDDVGDGSNPVTYAVALRNPDVINSTDFEGITNNIISYAESKVGSEYNTKGLFINPRLLIVKLSPEVYKDNFGEVRNQMSNWLGNVDIGLPDKSPVFCSQLIVEAFQAGGADLIKVNPELTSPQDILLQLKEGYLEYVGHLINGEDLI